LNEKHDSWSVIQKTMKLHKADVLAKLDINGIPDLDFFDAKLLYENVKFMVEANPSCIEGPAEKLFEWEKYLFAVFDEIRKALGINTASDKRKDELLNMMLAAQKKKKEYDFVKSDRDKFMKMRGSLDAKSQILGEMFKNFSVESVDWKGISEWQSKLDIITKKQECLIADSIYAAGVLTYFGPFSWISRLRMKEKWVSIFKEMSINTSDMPQISQILGDLGDPNKLSDWHNKNLLRDETCIENAFIFEHSSRWTLIIDPEGAAIRWMGGKEEIKDTNTYFKDELTKKMGQQSEIILTISREAMDIDIVALLQMPKKRKALMKMYLPSELIKADPTIDVKDKDHKNGPVQYDLHPNFNMNLRIEHSNPIFPDDICSTTSIINFALPPKALQDQFIIEYGFALGAAEYSEIILQKEDQLVRDIAREEMNLLKMMNQMILSQIDEKEQQDIKDHIFESHKILMEYRKRYEAKKEETRKENTEKLNAALPLALRSSVLYRCMSTLTYLNPMYLFNYGFVKEQFHTAIKANSESSSFSNQNQMNIGQLRDFANRMTGIISSNVYTSLERAMFTEDYHTFLFYAAACLSMEMHELSLDEWMVFLYGHEYIKDKNIVNPVKNPHIISDEWWNAIEYLERINPELYKGISNDILMHAAEWQIWTKSETPNKDLPGGFGEKFKKRPFQVLLILRIFCPGWVLSYKQWAIAEVLGSDCLKIKHQPIPEVFTTLVKVQKPLLIMKQEGEDPTSQVQNLGGENIKMQIHTLTSENEGDIRRTLEACKRPADKNDLQWFLIRDIHTMPDFGKFLADKIKEIIASSAEQHSSGEFNEKWFRLVLSCNPCRLPRTVLNNCIRYSMLHPTNMKQQVIKDLTLFQKQEQYALATPANKEKFTPAYRKLAMSLSILHAVLEKRSIFGQRAWTKPFYLTWGEVDVSGKLILNTLDSVRESQISMPGKKDQTRPQQMPWRDLRSLLSTNCIGGRMLEDYDLRTLSALVDVYINEDASLGNYAFSDKSKFKIPKLNTFAELIEDANKLPDTEDYEIFGMSPEVMKIGQNVDFENSLLAVQLIEQKKNPKSAPSKEVDEKMEAIVMKIVNEMPENEFTAGDISPTLNELKKGAPYANNLFLLQEKDRYNSMMGKIQRTMIKLKGCIQTGELMSPSLEKIYEAMAQGRVPEEFIGYNWNHPLGAWIALLKKRLNYMKEWLKTGETKGYWIRALMYPKGLFNALLAGFAQKYEKYVETLSFNFEITGYKDLSEITSPEPQTAYIYDLYMMNAKFNLDTQVLSDLMEPERLACTGSFKYSRMPVIAVRATDEVLENTGDYECPLYFLPTKNGAVGNLENLLTKIEIHTDLSSRYWIMKEVFMSCIDPDLNA